MSFLSAPAAALLLDFGRALGAGATAWRLPEPAVGTIDESLEALT